MKKFPILITALVATTLVGCTQSINNVPVTELTPNSAQYLTYTVKSGDTLSGIADQYQLDYVQLARMNNIPAPYIIHIGQVLRIPNPRYTGNSVTQQQQEYGGDTQPLSNENALPAQNLNLAQYGNANAPAAAIPAATTASSPVASTTPAVTTTNAKVVASPAPAQAATQAASAQAPTIKPRIIQTAPVSTTAATETAPKTAAASTTNQESDKTATSAVGQMVTIVKQETSQGITWSWPVSGRIIENFGQGQGLMAKGVQIRTGSNAKVLASAQGTVIYSGTGVNEYGKMVIIKSDNNFLTAYTNLSKLLVKQGQTIIRGGPVGIVGTIDGQPVLHFEVRKFGSPLNPLEYLPS